jgi:hypothetical protein
MRIYFLKSKKHQWGEGIAWYGPSINVLKERKYGKLDFLFLHITDGSLPLILPKNKFIPKILRGNPSSGNKKTIKIKKIDFSQWEMTIDGGGRTSVGGYFSWYPLIKKFRALM